MRLIHKIWDKFKTRPDEWFFYGFLLTFTLSIRKVLVFYPINGQFNEYAGIYLYLSDIFLILTLASWLFYILYNKLYILSIFNNVLRLTRENKMFHACPAKTKCSTWNILDFGGVEHFGFFRGGTLFIPLILVAWSFSSIIWSENQVLALFRSVKLLELYLLYLYVSLKLLLSANCSTWNNLANKNVPRGTILSNSLFIIIFVGAINSIIGIWQFLIQHSIGLFWLKESLISPEIAGVAKIIFNGERFIRAYGLFPHPNILGGFLLFSIICTWLYYKMFHVEQIPHRHSEKCSTWNIFYKQIVPRGTFYSPILTIQIAGLALTLSKSATLGLIIAIGYVIYKLFVPRGTKIISKLPKLFHVEQFYRKLILAIGIILILGLITRIDMNSLLFKSLNERMIYLNVSRGTISAHPILGVGAGQFVLSMQKYAQEKLEIWQFQPVHNVLLLIWSELGIIGLSLFIYFIYKLFHVEHSAYKNCSTWNELASKIVPRGTIEVIKITLKGVLLGYAFIILFDHYLWDIQQGELLLWITLGFLAGVTATRNNLSIDK